MNPRLSGQTSIFGGVLLLECIPSHDSIEFLCKTIILYIVMICCGRRGGLIVSALDSTSSGAGSSTGGGQCIVFLSKTHSSQSAPL